MNEFLNNLKFFLVGPYPNGELGGLAINLILSLATMVSGFVLGLLLALGRISGNRLLKSVCSFMIELIRAMPLILLVFWFYFMIPLFAGKPMPILLSAYLSITIYSAVNQAEIFRSGFMNIGKGQWQVAECTGLSYFQSVVYIILPQTLRMMLPSFVSFFISILKDTSVISIIGVIDLTHIGRMVSQRDPSKLIYSYVVMGVLYFIFCFALSRLAKHIEKKQGLGQNIRIKKEGAAFNN